MTYLQKQWLKALRSGDYKQTAGTLQTKDTYCCLGVACLIAEKNNVHVYRFANLKSIIGTTLMSQDHVNRALKFSSMGTSELIKLNDIAGKSFSEIADLVEETPTLFFEDTA